MEKGKRKQENIMRKSERITGRGGGGGRRKSETTDLLLSEKIVSGTQLEIEYKMSNLLEFNPD